jgi:hypothetical protein
MPWGAPLVSRDRLRIGCDNALRLAPQRLALLHSSCWGCIAIKPAVEQLRAAGGRAFVGAQQHAGAARLQLGGDPQCPKCPLPPVASPSGRHNKQALRPPPETQQSADHTVPAGRWRAAPPHPSPSSPMGALGGQPCSVCGPWPTLPPPLPRLALMSQPPSSWRGPLGS